MTNGLLLSKRDVVFDLLYGQAITQTDPKKNAEKTMIGLDIDVHDQRFSSKEDTEVLIQAYGDCLDQLKQDRPVYASMITARHPDMLAKIRETLLRLLNGEDSMVAALLDDGVDESNLRLLFSVVLENSKKSFSNGSITVVNAGMVIRYMSRVSATAPFQMKAHSTYPL